VLVALPAQRWRRLLVAFVVACTALPALQVALQLWHSPNALARFEGGRLVAGVGYGGGLAAAVAIGFWPLVAFASDRSTPRPMRPLAAAGAGLVLATVVPTEARASVWALVLSRSCSSRCARLPSAAGRSPPARWCRRWGYGTS